MKSLSFTYSVKFDAQCVLRVLFHNQCKILLGGGDFTLFCRVYALLSVKFIGRCKQNDKYEVSSLMFSKMVPSADLARKQGAFPLFPGGEINPNLEKKREKKSQILIISNNHLHRDFHDIGNVYNTGYDNHRENAKTGNKFSLERIEVGGLLLSSKVVIGQNQNPWTNQNVSGQNLFLAELEKAASEELLLLGGFRSVDSIIFNIQCSSRGFCFVFF